MNSPEIEQLFTRIAPLAGRAPAEFAISGLPGLTNRNFRLRATDADWVLRIPGVGSEHFIDRAAEAHNQRIAARLGVAPLWTWRDQGGLTLTPTLAGRNLRAADFADPALLQGVAATFRQLHRSGVGFQGRVEPGSLIERYCLLLPVEQRRIFADRRRRADGWLAELDAADLPAVPSHNDPVLANLLLDSERIQLIDWEFSAMASPYWDLATIANDAALDAATCRRLLAAYCAGGMVMEESLLYAYRHLLALLGDCWLAVLAMR